ncbi:four-carbon acid sugar kinase family protein [Paenarthrobacter sp. NPDC091711]|uniref:four-carbon acid sugar kinase family protein n=1 Tax=Paenarthrobacter sp. NPDC091711 TaxID=3364385 RepID=UPI0038038A52
MPVAADLLASFPEGLPISAADVAAAVARSRRVLVILDDDPTGTQSVADIPVLTSWDVDDFRWAFELRINEKRASAVYVLTNTRSLDPQEAAERNRQVVSAAIEAAKDSGTPLGFASRSDSTLRGHFPLEPDAIAETMAANGGGEVDGIVIVPAFPDAGRVTIGGDHFILSGESLTPVSETEFAQDATFGFSSSYLPAYVQEKSDGRIRADDVIVVDLNVIRSGPDAVAEALAPAKNRTSIVADIVTENDFRALALGLAEAERRGQEFIYRVGPPFVRGRIGQDPREPLEPKDVNAGGFQRVDGPSAVGGLIVVGSHVGVTTRQLRRLTSEHVRAAVIEIEVEYLLQGSGAQEYLSEVADRVASALKQGDVILHTSRLLVKTNDADESLRIARAVSAAVVKVVNVTLKTIPPRFVIAKGGITSSDVAAHGLEIRRAVVRGPMLPGIVSLWESVDGPARGMPFVVFAGNVGTDESLLEVTRKLSAGF